MCTALARVKAERERLQEKLRKLTRAWIENLVDDADYERHKAQAQFDLASLVVPEADAVAEAGRLLLLLPELWAKADLPERRRLLLTVLDAVFVEVEGASVRITLRPKAAFEAVLGGAKASVAIRQT